MDGGQGWMCPLPLSPTQNARKIILQFKTPPACQNISFASGLANLPM